MMSDLKDRILEEKLIVILRGLSEEKLIATVDILKNMGMHFFEPVSYTHLDVYKRQRYEQETIVSYNAGEQTATIYTRDKAVM